MGASDVTTAVPPVREALGAAGAARRWASSASSSLTARVREGWVTLHFAAARVKFPFVGDRQEIADLMHFHQLLRRLWELSPGHGRNGHSSTVTIGQRPRR